MKGFIHVVGSSMGKYTYVFFVGKAAGICFLPNESDALLSVGSLTQCVKDTVLLAVSWIWGRPRCSCSFCIFCNHVVSG